jgi:hypothetical protein
MNKRGIGIIVLILISVAGFAEAPKKSMAVEWNAGFLMFFGVEVEADFNLGALTPALNGIDFHGSLFLRTSNIFSEYLYPHYAGTVFSGYGASIGPRFFFGESGVSGFFLGLQFLYAWIHDYAPSHDSSGNVYILAPEIGARFLIVDTVSITIGASAGINLATLPNIYAPYLELILGIGFVL